LSGQWVILLLGAVLGGLFVYSIGDAINEILKNRREELMLQFPPVLSQLILLVSSGMVMRDAWKKVAESGQGLLYTEMQKTLTEMNNGVMEIQAYQNFAFRCNVREIRKFSTAVIQNIQKGSKELVGYLRDMSDEMWNAKKAIVKRKGDAAASKLLMPTVLIFIGILFMILAPMLSSMQI
jgi:tight adherence protein C